MWRWPIIIIIIILYIGAFIYNTLALHYYYSHGTSGTSHINTRSLFSTGRRNVEYEVGTVSISNVVRMHVLNLISRKKPSVELYTEQLTYPNDSEAYVVVCV